VEDRGQPDTDSDSADAWLDHERSGQPDTDSDSADAWLDHERSGQPDTLNPVFFMSWIVVCCIVVSAVVKSAAFLDWAALPKASL
jgi:hypothetical protein